MSENKDVAHSQPEPVLAAVVDFETMSTENDAVIPSFGVVFGDLVTGIIDRELYVEFDVQQQIESGRRIDASTLAFWLKQDHTARMQLAAIMDQPEARVSFEQGMAQLTSFLKRLPKRTRVVGNGPTFDLSIILKHTGMANSPYPFWEERSLRDWRDLCMLLTNTDPAKDHKFVGVKHNGLDDARNEFAIMSKALNRMRGTAMENLLRNTPAVTINLSEDQQSELKELLASDAAHPYAGRTALYTPGKPVELVKSDDPKRLHREAVAQLVADDAEKAVRPLFTEYVGHKLDPALPEGVRTELEEHFKYIDNCVHRGDMAEIIDSQKDYELLHSVPHTEYPVYVLNGVESAEVNRSFALVYKNVPGATVMPVLLRIDAWNMACANQWVMDRFNFFVDATASCVTLVEIPTPAVDYSELTMEDDGSAGVGAELVEDPWFATLDAVKESMARRNLTDLINAVASYASENELQVNLLPECCRTASAKNVSQYVLHFTGSAKNKACPLLRIYACDVGEAYLWLRNSFTLYPKIAAKLRLKCEELGLDQGLAEVTGGGGVE